MATLWKTYPTDGVAHEAAEALRAAGVPGRDIRLLIGSRWHDVREEPTGGFAGPVGPEAPVGTFAGTVRLRRQGNGSFAGDSDRQRQGSFADAEHDVIVSYQDGAARSRLVGDHAIRRLLRGVALAGDPGGRLVDDLHRGHAVVIAEVAEIAPRDAQARLEHMAHAA
jgi:hypothetical protein